MNEEDIIVTSAPLSYFENRGGYDLKGSDFSGYLKQDLEIYKRHLIDELITEKDEFPIIEEKLKELGATHGVSLEKITSRKAKIVLKVGGNSSHISTDHEVPLYRVTPIFRGSSS